jgi:hypothetical protein
MLSVERLQLPAVARTSSDEFSYASKSYQYIHGEEHQAITIMAALVRR